MTIGDDSIQLPDGEELVVIDREDWLVSPRPDPRETSLDLRRRVGARVTPHSAPPAPRPPSTHPAT